MATDATPDTPEPTEVKVCRSWNGGVVACLLEDESDEVLDILDPLQAWGRPVSASVVEAERELQPAPGDGEVPFWGTGAVIRTVRVSVFCSGTQVGFSECLVIRRPMSLKQRTCRICFESDCELLDGCACRGTMRFICRDCLIAQWKMRAKGDMDKASTSLSCITCHQMFAGKAAKILADQLSSAVEKHTVDVPAPAPAEEYARYKAQVATATQLWNERKDSEAASLFRKTIDGLTSLKGPKDPLVLSCQHNLSLLLESQGSVAEAKVLVQQAHAGFVELYGLEHPLALKAAHNEAMIAQTAGHLAEARDGYQACLEIRRRVLGPDHLDTLKTACNLGLVMHNMGDNSEAEALLRTTLQGLERVVGRRNPVALVALQNLSLVLAQRDPMPVEAEELACEAVQEKQRVLGPDHPTTLEGRRDYASVLIKSGKREEAEEALRQTLAGMQKFIGFNHPRTETVVRQLHGLLNDSGKAAEAQELIDEHNRKAPVSDVKLVPEPPPEGNLILVILSLYIAGTYRCRGLGRATLDHWKELARELRAEAVEAYMPETASVAIAFFIKCGFVKAKGNEEAKEAEAANPQKRCLRLEL